MSVVACGYVYFVVTLPDGWKLFMSSFRELKRAYFSRFVKFRIGHPLVVTAMVRFLKFLVYFLIYLDGS